MQNLSFSFDRALGCLLGLATGDDLGTTLEFTQPGAFQPLEEMAGGVPFLANGIPAHWRETIAMRSEIETMADQLWKTGPRN